MGNVIKRRHTSEYAQIHNKPLQDDLTDLRAIGLLSHMMSRDINWVFHKSQLHSQFSRKNVDAAWKLLVEKNYIMGFYCHVSGRKKYFYNVSDLPFTSEDFYEFVKEEVRVLTEEGETVKHVNPIDGLTLDTTELATIVPNVQQSKNFCSETIVPKEQHLQNSSKGASKKEIYKNKDSKTNNIKDDDYKANSVTPSEQNSESIELVIQSVREQTKDLIITRSFNTVVGRVMAKHINGDIKIGFREYLVGAVYKHIEQLDKRRAEQQAKESLARTSQSGASEEYTGNIVFYNFLDEKENEKARQPFKK